MSGSHEMVREPHPPGQSATPRLQAKDQARPGRFYTPRGQGAAGGDDDVMLPDINTPTAVLGMVSDSDDPSGIDALVTVRQVRLKGGAQVNVGRGAKVHGRPVHLRASATNTKSEGKVGFMKAAKKDEKVDLKAEQRKRLIAKLPVIEHDPQAQAHMISKYNRQLVESHNELSTLKQLRIKKRERVNDLRDKFADVCRDSGLDVGLPTAKPAKGAKGGAKGKGGLQQGGSTALVVSKGSVDPKVLRVQSELSKLRRKMEGLNEERMAMECMRERMESEWILSVARLRDKRTIMAQHEGNDDALTKDYLNQCMLENSHAQGDLRAERRQITDDGRKRNAALEGLRMKVALEMNTLKMDEVYEERKAKVIAAQAGDLDANGEKRLKTRVVTGHFRALMINNQSQRSMEEKRKIVERLDKIKEVTGAKDAENLIVRYEELKATNKAMSQQKDESNLRITQLEDQRDALRHDLEHIGEYGIGGETSKSEINGYEHKQREANVRSRHSFRQCSQAQAMVSASRITVQSLLMALKRVSKPSVSMGGRASKNGRTFQIDIIAQTTDDTRYTDSSIMADRARRSLPDFAAGGGGKPEDYVEETAPYVGWDERLVTWLEKCGEHLQAIEEDLPDEYRTLLNEGAAKIDLSEPTDWKKADPNGELHLGARVWQASILSKFEDHDAAARVRGVQQVVLNGFEVAQNTKEALNRMNVNELRQQAREDKIAVTLVQSAMAGENEKSDLIRYILQKCAPTQAVIATRIQRAVPRDEDEVLHPAAGLRIQGEYFFEEGVASDAEPQYEAGMIYFMSDENPGHKYRHGIEVKLMTAADLAEQTRTVSDSNNWRIDVDQMHATWKNVGEAEENSEGGAIAFLNLNVNADRFNTTMDRKKEKHAGKGGKEGKMSARERKQSAQLSDDDDDEA